MSIECFKSESPRWEFDLLAKTEQTVNLQTGTLFRSHYNAHFFSNSKNNNLFVWTIVISIGDIVLLTALVFS